jgi:hypothetical protein
MVMLDGRSEAEAETETEACASFDELLIHSFFFAEIYQRCFAFHFLSCVSPVVSPNASCARALDAGIA